MSDGTLTGVFEAERPRLVAVARRMLGSQQDAEDAVQEAWLRLSRSDDAAIANLAGWLTTVVGRICLDVLRTRSAHPATSYDDLLVLADEPVLEAGPDAQAELADSVGMALLVVLETLSPTERLAFVLQDLFGVPFAEIAQVLGTSPDAAKMAASRARRKVRGAAPPEQPDAARGREVVEAFLAAARTGDFAGLLSVLHPDVVLRADTPGGVVVTRGATEVAGRARMFAVRADAIRPVVVDGLPGFLAWSPAGVPMSLMTFAITDGRIGGITALADPDRLARVSLPAAP